MSVSPLLETPITSTWGQNQPLTASRVILTASSTVGSPLPTTPPPGTPGSDTPTPTTGDPSPTTTSPAPTSDAPVPSPTQPGTIESCKKYHLHDEDDGGCDGIAKKYNISLSDFHKWNPEVGEDCSALWLNYYVCVGA